MTRLVCLAAGSLLLALSLCQLESAEAVPQLSPEVKKISILDLFQEEPRLKAELEMRLMEKGKKPVPVGGGGTPREARTEALPSTTTSTTTTSTTTRTTTTAAPEASSTTTAAPEAFSTTSAASEDKQSPRALRPRGRPSRTSGPESAVAAADDTEPAATEEGASTTTTDAEAPGAAGGPARKLRPQRLTLRRQRPGQAVAASTTTEGSVGDDLPEPELEEGLVKTLVEGSDAEGGPEAKEEVAAEPAVPATKPRARFSLPPRNGAVTGSSAPANKKVEEAPAEEKASSGLDRLRNARIGGGRLRNSGGRQTPAAPAAAPAAADEASPATADDASAKPLNRLSLAERRSRFSNARTPPAAAAAEEAAAPQEEETAAAADEAAAEETPRRNARRFPVLARRNS